MTTGTRFTGTSSTAATTNPTGSTLWLRNPMAVHLGRDVDAAQASGGIVIDKQSGTIVELVPAGGEPPGGAQSVA
ncbi:MAG: 8-oxoguanine deaminase, partial [Brevibacterium aurantiacum]|nr:8-oxoguanine deaminase [Brevibacterium aurantiacum]